MLMSELVCHVHPAPRHRRSKALSHSIFQAAELRYPTVLDAIILEGHTILPRGAIESALKSRETTLREKFILLSQTHCTTSSVLEAEFWHQHNQ